MDHEQIHKKVGRNLLTIRKARQLSLDQVADLTGVSKAMLGQIERGDSNPTISVLWKIVNGLNISFTSLIEEKEADISIVHKTEIEPFEEEDGHYRAYPLFPFDSKKRFEIYQVEIDPGCSHASEPHFGGVEEYILVMSGEIYLTLQQDTHRIGMGDSVRFFADKTHIYENRSEESALIHTIIFYP